MLNYKFLLFLCGYRLQNHIKKIYNSKYNVKQINYRYIGK